jgi:hypothetical protein
VENPLATASTAPVRTGIAEAGLFIVWVVCPVWPRFAIYCTLARHRHGLQYVFGAMRLFGQLRRDFKCNISKARQQS